MADDAWWRGGIIYQIYPRSFLDASGDGVGDLEGILRRLDHVAGLGVDAVWISPFFRSPMQDFGYDVADYRAVDPMFGSLETFDRVLAEAHRLGLRVLIDQVPSHTSDQHPWFLESRASRDNPRADWYVWVDPKPDGMPPNNWLSVFGGSAWQWDSVRCQYYLHNFLASQPDLNYHNPAVQDAMLAEMRFWLERGVDGFRLDAINFCFHDAALRDNPPRAGRAAATTVSGPENPYSWQVHVYDKSRPEMIGWLRHIRSLAREFGDAVLMGEIGDERGPELMAEYTAGGERLHMAYSFDLLTERGDAAYLRERVEGTVRALGENGYACWSIGNHDVPRVVTRWGRGAPPEKVAPLYLALLLSLPGAACLYQGDELGLPEADLTYEDLRDPYGIRFWPRFRGRDGCRTPMPWAADPPGAGFTTGRPWLPIPEAHRPLAVDRQAGVPGSVLEACRAFIAWRRGYPALRHGAARFHEAPPGVLLLERHVPGERLLAAFNLTASPAQVPLPGPVAALAGNGFGGRLVGGAVELEGHDAFFGRILGRG
ncbi:alpha-glucosidase [Spiribacter halobius]|uniref:Alpha-glucosidase n=1 Tax=Sediminicurvatus halobius TaxID=2182432 RepID=A0A2U2MZB3_9GAMM|nr:alpha-glucosidase [Spiribacter halobius]